MALGRLPYLVAVSTHNLSINTLLYTVDIDTATMKSRFP
jgi:hypothetical protein